MEYAKEYGFLDAILHSNRSFYETFPIMVASDGLHC
jgi:hypothetical protein